MITLNKMAKRKGTIDVCVYFKEDEKNRKNHKKCSSQKNHLK